MRRVAPAIPLADMLEKQLEQQVIGTKTNPGLARILQWRCYHTLRSQGSEPGYPDWTLIRERVVWLELKTEKGVVSDRQVEWLRALRDAGAEAYIVRPRHLELIALVLQYRGRIDLDNPDVASWSPIAPLIEELNRELGKKAA